MSLQLGMQKYNIKSKLNHDYQSIIFEIIKAEPQIRNNKNE